MGLKFLVIGTSANVDLSIEHSMVNFQSPPPILFFSREAILTSLSRFSSFISNFPNVLRAIIPYVE